MTAKAHARSRLVRALSFSSFVGRELSLPDSANIFFRFFFFFSQREQIKNENMYVSVLPKSLQPMTVFIYLSYLKFVFADEIKKSRENCKSEW